MSIRRPAIVVTFAVSALLVLGGGVVFAYDLLTPATFGWTNVDASSSFAFVAGAAIITSRLVIISAALLTAGLAGFAALGCYALGRRNRS
ncbi:hypothetical protein FHX48_002674 [Microbacterium halimionae]|uniref:Uncharacterized protein n=1 Tax=Microbacterium halimionae TaxID=1526413 RepID=A0A7W3JRA1_9MICO|nr:hypothetical protein [Microbacterium halimionae]MBA8817569.1 hypothetical protein [Microbacterium halimionae]NII94279.1 hypothetical protein [Microbacterium halimionae]